MARANRNATIAGMSDTDLMELIQKNYTFGRLIDARLEAYVKKINDPLKDPQDIFDEKHLNGLEVEHCPASAVLPVRDRVRFGTLDSYDVNLYNFTGGRKDSKHSGVKLEFGCTFFTRDEIIDHFDGDRSTRSDEYRPGVQALIEYITRVANHLGWKW